MVSVFVFLYKRKTASVNLHKDLQYTLNLAFLLIIVFIQLLYVCYCTKQTLPSRDSQLQCTEMSPQHPLLTCNI